MEGLPAGNYRLDAGDAHSQRATVNNDGAWTVALSLCDAAATTTVSIRRVKSRQSQPTRNALV